MQNSRPDSVNCNSLC